MKPLSERDENPDSGLNRNPRNFLVGMKPLSERDENIMCLEPPIITS